MIRALMLVPLLTMLAAPQVQRDTSAVKPTVIGSASVSGIVTLGDEAQTVVRRAVVTLQTLDGLDNRTTLTDDAGRFTIEGLPAGRYSVQALKAAHITTALGARRPGRPGTALVITDGQRVTDLRLSLPRGGVLAGRLTLENGQPAPDMLVSAIPTRLMSAGGTTSTTTTTEFRTNDLGEFRIYGLLPDSYVLAALPIVGNGEIQQRSEADYDALVRTLTSAAGAAPAAANSGRAVTASPRGYAPIYFPGTPNGADAARIALAPGDVKDGLSFVISTVPMSTIRGTVTGASGEPVRSASVSVEFIGPPLPLTMALGPRPNRPNAQGEFSVSGLGPGRYRVRARAGGVLLNADGSLQSIRGDAQTEWAVAEVTVDGRDVEGLGLALQPGRLLRGRVLAEGGTTPESWTGTFVTVQPIRTSPGIALDGLIGGVDSRRAVVEANGRFEVIGLEPHVYEIAVTLPAALSTAGWTLGAIRAGDRDLRDAPLTFADGSLDNVEIVLTTAVTELSGRFTSESGTPATDYFVVAFPADRALWHPASPRVRVMRPAADGLFSTRDLPPGTYRLAALIDVEPDEHRRAEFLESIYEAGIAVTVTAGTVTRQDVRIR